MAELSKKQPKKPSTHPNTTPNTTTQSWYFILFSFTILLLKQKLEMCYTKWNSHEGDQMAKQVTQIYKTPDLLALCRQEYFGSYSNLLCKGPSLTPLNRICTSHAGSQLPKDKNMQIPLLHVFNKQILFLCGPYMHRKVLAISYRHCFICSPKAVGNGKQKHRTKSSIQIN